ncbi:hypothetical protein C5Z25_01665 [Lactobacillus sp. CBA3605]|uniref:DUF1351 domain-containing protein n=1 Tax=Lactobacillus sp. CBA3605 TaxID=2099788 RepID=UPI000CFA8496|nr:DUF1351 domain-containing protein [Lactobacillus sp. CBA3605]AVK60554.1 hypothetical protein C5Z25_01665 [Lactobacillus sp. CBA3605]
MDNSLINLPDYTVDYKPVPIIINNLDGLQAAIAQYVARYSDLVITEGNVKDTKQVRAKLNSLKRALDERRKEIKRGYNQPLKEFEVVVKTLENQIDTVIAPIDMGLSELEVQRRQQREDELLVLLDEMAPNYGIEVNEIEIDPRWLNKSISHKQVITEIAASMTTIKNAKDKLETDTQMINRYATVQHVDPLPWVDQLDQGQDVQHLLVAIDKQVKSTKERQRQQDLQAQVDAEHQVQTKSGKIVDTNTGEVVSLTRILKITATRDKMWDLSTYMKQHDIKFETVEG